MDRTIPGLRQVANMNLTLAGMYMHPSLSDSELNELLMCIDNLTDKNIMLFLLNHYNDRIRYTLFA